MWKQFNSEYLNFSKKQRIGTFVVLGLVGFFTVLPFLFPFFLKPKVYDHSSFEKAIASLKIKQADNTDSFENKYPNNRTYKNYTSSNASKYENSSMKGELFYFDPNTATTAGSGIKRLLPFRIIYLRAANFIRKKTSGKFGDYTKM